MQTTNTETKKRPKPSGNPYDWSKVENRKKAKYRLWICYKRNLAAVFTGNSQENTSVHYGYYRLKDFGLAKLKRIINIRQRAIYKAIIYDVQTNLPFETFTGIVDEKAVA